LLSLVLFNLLFFRHEYFTQAILHGSGTDLVSYQYPVLDFVRSELLAGRFPYVLPHVFGGQPLHAVGQAGITYPPNWLLMLPGTFVWIKLSVALHVLLASVLAFFLTDRLAGDLASSPWGAGKTVPGTWARAAGAALAGLAYAYGGFFLLHAYAGHVNLLASAAWMPGLWLAMWCMADSWRASVMAGLVLALMVLAGAPQVVLLGGMTGIPWFLAAWGAGLVRRCGPERRRHALVGAGRALLAVIAGIGLSAVQLVPMLEVAGESARAAAQGSESMTWSLPVSGLWNVMFPWFWGHAEQGWWVALSRWEFAGYVGLGPILLAVMAAAGCRRGAALLVGAALCLLAALGENGFLYPLLVKTVPLLDDFRVPARFLLPGTLFLAVGAGLGAARLGAWQPVAKQDVAGQDVVGQDVAGQEEILAPEPSRGTLLIRKNLHLALLALAALPGIVALWLGLRAMLGSMPDFLVRYVESMGGEDVTAEATRWLGAGFLLEAVVALVVVSCAWAAELRRQLVMGHLPSSVASQGRGWGQRCWSAAPSLLVAAAVAIALSVAGSGLLSGGSPGAYRVGPEAAGLLDRIPDGQRVLHFEQRGWNRLYRHGLENIGGYEPALSARMNLFANVATFGEKGVEAVKVWALWPTDASARPSAALSFAGVSHAVVRSAGPFLRAGWVEEASPPEGNQGDLRLGAEGAGEGGARSEGAASAPTSAVSIGGEYRLLRNPKAAPIAFCPQEIVEATSPQEAARWIASGSGDARTTAVVETGGAGRGAGLRTRTGVCRLGLIGEVPGIVGYRVEADEPAVLVVAQQAGAGWMCEVDGERVPAMAANIVSSACRVPPGTHDVLVRLIPVTFFSGEALSLSTAALLVLILGGLWYKRRKTCVT
jgi:hypothetical protein